MSVTLNTGGADTFQLNDTTYYKGYVTFERRWPDRYDVIIDGSVIYEGVHYHAFLDGDNADEPFANPDQLEAWIDSYANVYHANAQPFRVVSTASTNELIVKAGKTLIHHLSVTNVSETAYYLKIYDDTVAPDATDTPVLTFPIPAQSEDKPLALIQTITALKQGFGIRITAGIADGDETPVNANEVFVNALYQ